MAAGAMAGVGAGLASKRELYIVPRRRALPLLPWGGRYASGQAHVTAPLATVPAQLSGLVAVLGKGSPEWAKTPWKPMLLTVTLGDTGIENDPPQRSALRLC